jgi:hypothetical protein
MQDSSCISRAEFSTCLSLPTPLITSINSVTMRIPQVVRFTADHHNHGFWKVRNALPTALNHCNKWRAHSGAAENSSLLRCYVVSNGNFRRFERSQCICKVPSLWEERRYDPSQRRQPIISWYNVTSPKNKKTWILKSNVHSLPHLLRKLNILLRTCFFQTAIVFFIQVYWRKKIVYSTSNGKNQQSMLIAVNVTGQLFFG